MAATATRLRWWYSADPDLNRVLNRLAERAVVDERRARRDAVAAARESAGITSAADPRRS